MLGIVAMVSGSRYLLFEYLDQDPWGTTGGCGIWRGCFGLGVLHTDM